MTRTSEPVYRSSYCLSRTSARSGGSRQRGGEDDDGDDDGAVQQKQPVQQPQEGATLQQNISSWAESYHENFHKRITRK
jgi:hypothetical protein